MLQFMVRVTYTWADVCSGDYGGKYPGNKYPTPTPISSSGSHVIPQKVDSNNVTATSLSPFYCQSSVELRVTV